MPDLHFDFENNNNKNQQKLKPKSAANYARLSSARINKYVIFPFCVALKNIPALIPRISREEICFFFREDSF